MGSENLHVKLEGEGKKELIVYTAKELDKRNPVPLKLSGMHITTPAIYLAKRKPAIEDVVVIKDVRARTISVTSASVPGEGEVGSLQSVIVGKIDLNPDLVALKINDPKALWGLRDMKNHVKANRRFFHSREQYDRILAKLDDFNGKVEAEVKAKRDDRGNASASYDKRVSMDFDSDFNIRIPLFDDFDPVIIKVQLCFDMQSNGSVDFYLMSEDLAESIDEQAESIIDVEIAKISGLDYMILH